MTARQGVTDNARVPLPYGDPRLLTHAISASSMPATSLWLEAYVRTLSDRPTIEEVLA